MRGLEALGELWEREREGHDEPFELEREVVAVEGEVGVARVQVKYGRTGYEYRDLWVIRLAGDGRCRDFEEWPFFPGQPVSARGGDR